MIVDNPGKRVDGVRRERRPETINFRTNYDGFLAAVKEVEGVDLSTEEIEEVDDVITKICRGDSLLSEDCQIGPNAHNYNFRPDGVVSLSTKDIGDLKILERASDLGFMIMAADGEVI